jgi:hypothetical protein
MMMEETYPIDHKDNGVYEDYEVNKDNEEDEYYDMYQGRKVYSGSQSFWDMFVDRNIHSKLNYKYEDRGDYIGMNCWCDCHAEFKKSFADKLKSIIEFNKVNYADNYDSDDWDYGYIEELNELSLCCDACQSLGPYIKAYNDILKMIEECKDFNGYVFLDLSIVSHNINMRGDSTSSYISGDEAVFNKELILLLKEPEQTMSYEIVTDTFEKVRNTLYSMTNFHFNRRSFYFEGLKYAGTGQDLFYDKYMSKDITTKNYNTSLIGMMNKLTQKFESRDEYAEYSSDMYYDVVIKKKFDNKVYEVRWGS